MLRDVASVKFFCYDGTRWNETWDTSDVTAVNTNLPLAVRVEIYLAGTGEKLEPIQMVVPIDSVSRSNTVAAGATGG
jgi:hypothetical protein